MPRLLTIPICIVNWATAIGSCGKTIVPGLPAIGAHAEQRAKPPATILQLVTDTDMIPREDKTDENKNSAEEPAQSEAESKPKE
jgi:hypothetical protein